MSTPTDEVSDDLQHAYNHFNKLLFAGTLPADIVLSYQREALSFGFVRKRQYLHLSCRESHELTLNPSWIPHRGLTETLATLVHNMCRFYLSLVGLRPSRGGYHNRELADLLKMLGLLPRVDGDPNGKETGHRIRVLVKDGGPFDVACRKLLADGFAFAWVDRVAGISTYNAKLRQCRAPENRATATISSNPTGPIAPPPVVLPPPYTQIQDKLDYRPVTGAGQRRKYQCPTCGKQFWGGHGIEAKCVPCGRRFIDTDPATARRALERRK